MREEEKKLKKVRAKKKERKEGAVYPFTTLLVAGELSNNNYKRKTLLKILADGCWFQILVSKENSSLSRGFLKLWRVFPRKPVIL